MTGGQQSCAGCGTELGPNAAFCPVCGAPAAVDRSTRPPDSVAAGPQPRSNAVVASAVIAVVAVLGISVGVLLSRSLGGSEQAGDPDPTTTRPVSDDRPTSTVLELPPSSLTPPSPTTSSSTTTPVSRVEGTGLAGWIAQFGSFRDRDGAERRLLEVLEQDPTLDVRILHSSDYASLSPRYYVPYAGPFADGPSAYAACSFVNDPCVGNYVSQDVADCPRSYPQTASNCP